MKTPDEVKREHETEMLSASGAVKILYDQIAALKERNRQLEEQIMLMKEQMYGDCGVCAHRDNAQITRYGPEFSGPCADCIQKESRPNWKYEGLPEVKSR